MLQNMCKIKSCQFYAYKNKKRFFTVMLHKKLYLYKAINKTYPILKLKPAVNIKRLKKF